MEKSLTKAVISNKIYMHASPELTDTLVEKLTYRFEVSGAGGKTDIQTVRNYSVPSTGIIAIPQGRQDLIPSGYEIVDKRVYKEIEYPDPTITLRDSQQPIWDAWTDSGLLNAPVGWGKSFTALWISMKLQQKTLIVAHTTMLRDQWLEDTEKMFGFKPGNIGSGKYSINAPVTIGNVQSVTKHATKLANEFGTIIIDECHHTPASTFSNVLEQSKARYRLGLSGTLKRKDGKHVMFPDYFGPIVFKPEKSNTIDPIIKIIRTGQSLPDGNSWPEKITKLCNDKSYIDLITLLAINQFNKGHKVLIVADRVEFLKTLHDRFGSRSILVVGDVDSYERKAELISKQLEDPEVGIVCGSRQIFAEGISVNLLSCLILATPYSWEGLLEQLIGRIQRLHPDKPQPLVIDLQFNNPSQNSARLGLYFNQGWKVEFV